jgi:MFS family permease
MAINNKTDWHAVYRAMLFTVEGAPAHRRGLYGAVSLATAVIGITLGSFVGFLVYLLPDHHLYSWGWRLPFLSSLIVGES